MTFGNRISGEHSRSRRRRLWLIVGALGSALAAFVVFYFEPQAAFIDDTVDESLPGLDAVLATTAAPSTAAPSTAAPSTAVPATTVPLPANSLAGALARAGQTAQPVVVSTGSFFSGEHDTTGTALVVALPDGSLVVRFEDLETSNGPDLRVVLSPEPASDAWQYDDRLHLGELKGNIGDQNYTIGADVDLSRYRSVVIWCERFSVAFGAAAIDVVV